MSQYTFIGEKLSMAALRAYIITHKVNEGDSLVLNSYDYRALIEEVKAVNDEFPDLPLELLGVIIAKDSTDSVPIGKVQIVNSEKPF